MTIMAHAKKNIKLSKISFTVFAVVRLYWCFVFFIAQHASVVEHSASWVAFRYYMLSYDQQFATFTSHEHQKPF